jgi:hypothetical protein
MTHDENWLGLGLILCSDGERIVAIDAAGRVARANVKIAVGDILIDVGGCPASEAKAGLIAGTSLLSAGKVSITVLQLGRTEPTTIELPPVDRSSMEPCSQPAQMQQPCNWRGWGAE